MLTPRIDSLTREGAFFNAMHCPATVCMPSRYAMLSDHHASRCLTGSFRERFPPELMAEVGFNTHIYSERQRSSGHVLQDAGFRTGYVGKWHAGPDKRALDAPALNEDDDPADPGSATRIHVLLG